MVSQITINRVREFCIPALSSGLIDESELNELLNSSTNKQIQKESIFFTKREVAEKLRVSIRQLDRLHDRGLIQYLKAGLRSVRIPSESLDKFVEQRIK